MNLNKKVFLIPDWMIFLSFLKRDGKVNLSTLNTMSHINYSGLHRIKKELTNLEWITNKDKEETFTYAVLTEKGKIIADIISKLFDTLELTTDELFEYRRVKHSLKFGDISTSIEKPKEELVKEVITENEEPKIEVTEVKEEVKEVKEDEESEDDNNTVPDEIDDKEGDIDDKENINNEGI
jgi:predicted transcriptional regulator